MEASLYKDVRLCGGFIIVSVEFTDDPIVDAIGREATAKTGIVGMRFEITIRRSADERELSVSLYHEVLEAATVASFDPPESVVDFNEGDFEQTAQRMHQTLGAATPANLNLMLQAHGFRATTEHG